MIRYAPSGPLTDADAVDELVAQHLPVAAGV